MNKFWVRCFIAALAMLVIDLFFSPTQSSYSLESIFWNAISSLLISITMGFVAKYAHAKKARLAFDLWLISFTIGSFNILIEAWIFNVTDSYATFIGLLHGAFKFGFMAVLLTYVFPYDIAEMNRDALAKRSVFQWIWKMAVGVLLYLFFYLAAGMILQASLPELSEYYKGKMPEFLVIIYTQIFRGFIFVGIAIYIQKMVSPTPKLIYAILVGLVFSILGGIGPLIPSNNLMPAIIRLGHGFEVGTSNFIYGFLTALMLYRSRVGHFLPVIGD